RTDPMQHTYLAVSARQGGRTLRDGRGSDRGGVDRADRARGHHARSRARVGVYRRQGSARDREARARRERLSDSVSLPAAGVLAEDDGRTAAFGGAMRSLIAGAIGVSLAVTLLASGDPDGKRWWST